MRMLGMVGDQHAVRVRQTLDVVDLDGLRAVREDALVADGFDDRLLVGTRHRVRSASVARPLNAFSKNSSLVLVRHDRDAFGDDGADTAVWSK